MLGRAVNLYFITKYKNISTRKPKYCRAAMRIKEFILYGLTYIKYVEIFSSTYDIYFQFQGVILTPLRVKKNKS